MPSSTIDFSAVFGGQDAADVVLPHFKALKAAARGLCLEGFPFAKLAFILRVDGEVHIYGPSGLEHLEIDKDGKYLSVDIGITQEDRNRLPGVIQAALRSSIKHIKTLAETSSWDVDYEALQQRLDDLCTRYENEILQF